MRGLAGADTISAGNGIGALTQLTLDGAAGDDTVRGGDGNDVLLAGAGDDLVDGNIGADSARLGAGNDTFQWDPGDGSGTVEGQGGSDVLAFNASNAGEQIAVSANGPRVRRAAGRVAAVLGIVTGAAAASASVHGAARSDPPRRRRARSLGPTLLRPEPNTPGADRRSGASEPTAIGSGARFAAELTAASAIAVLPNLRP